ncbi:MAG TPA: enoyl-[acyl-carrier-protein] reductase FabK [Candidatus Borkfalkia faecigallinarum]|uniref:Probable nitronate monooxygenase n=1 Tax=Candidatus Borkfalkia faecigallinarum TaxID=2838509 RepID=A0A9D1VUP9_9FIRM|nr:enoyl-[acyl-carrier-protein] reductase FabK [Candidatus Borkfalkia faecigallinarum]
MQTKLTKLLGIRHPIIQGGMAWIADASLASAVSNAGGLGIISAMNAGADWVREEIRKCRTMTDKPFGVNIMLMSPHVEEVAAMVAEEKVPVVTTGAGNPSRFVKMWKEAGVKILPVVASTALAKMVERAGVDAVIAEGGESGGHVGDLTTMALVPQVADAVGIPVVAAGGIGDGRGMVAAFALGACGVQMGTRFLVADECTVSDEYKKKVLAAKDISTAVTGRRLGHPVRAIKNSHMNAYAKLEADSNVPDEELEKFGVGSLRLAAKEGDAEHGCFLAGQIAGMVKKRQPAKEIVDEVMAQAEQMMEGVRWDV